MVARSQGAYVRYAQTPPHIYTIRRRAEIKSAYMIGFSSDMFDSCEDLGTHEKSSSVSLLATGSGPPRVSL